MHPLAALAKMAIENFIKKRKVISLPNGFPEEFLKKKAGTFVTIEKNKVGSPVALRGCIGTYLPTKENIAKETIYNAIAAATQDYRFGQVQEEELSFLKYTVYVLSEPKLIKDLKELDPKKYGIILRTAPISPLSDVIFNGQFLPKTGILLPDLEGVDTIEKQISIACQKGGIDPKKEKIFIYKFTVKKYQ